jgi:hypothetical protein
MIYLGMYDKIILKLLFIMRTWIFQLVLDSILLPILLNIAKIAKILIQIINCK